MLICKIFHSFFDLRLEERVARQLYHFKSEIERRKQSNLTLEQDKFFPELFEVSSKHWTEIKIQDPSILPPTDGSPIPPITLDQYLHRVLLDTSLYEYGPLTTSALALLFRHMKPHDELVTTLSKVQILVEDEDVKVFYSAKAKLAKLRSILKDNDVSESETGEIEEIIREFIKMCTISEGNRKN